MVSLNVLLCHRLSADGWRSSTLVKKKFVRPEWILQVLVQQCVHIHFQALRDEQWLQKMSRRGGTWWKVYEREFFRQFVCFYVDIKSSNGEKLLNNQSVHSTQQRTKHDCYHWGLAAPVWQSIPFIWGRASISFGKGRRNWWLILTQSILSLFIYIGQILTLKN